MENQPDPLSPEYEAMVLERFVLMRELDTKVDLGQLTQAEADQWGYCLQVGCKYSRGYKKPKGKDKK